MKLINRFLRDLNNKKVLVNHPIYMVELKESLHPCNQSSGKLLYFKKNYNNIENNCKYAVSM